MVTGFGRKECGSFKDDDTASSIRWSGKQKLPAGCYRMHFFLRDQIYSLFPSRLRGCPISSLGTVNQGASACQTELEIAQGGSKGFRDTQKQIRTDGHEHSADSD